MNPHRNPFGVFAVFLVLSATSLAQTSQFTYQGKLTDAGVPANGQYDLTFKLFDFLSGGTQIGVASSFPMEACKPRRRRIRLIPLLEPFTLISWIRSISTT